MRCQAHTDELAVLRHELRTLEPVIRRVRASGHPSSETLDHYRRGILPAHESKQLRAHLVFCDICFKAMTF